MASKTAVSVERHRVSTPLKPANAATTKQVNVGAVTPVRLDTPVLPNRSEVEVHVLSADDSIYFAFTEGAATLSTGYRIQPGADKAIRLGPDLELWAISAAQAGDTAQNNVAGTSEQVTGGSVQDPANLLDADSDFATFDAAGDEVTVTGFTAPAAEPNIVGVKLGIQAKKSSSAGTDPTITLTYTLGGDPDGASSGLVTITNDGATADYQVDVSGDRGWLAADIAALEYILTATTVVNRDIHIAFAYLEITEESSTITRICFADYSDGTPDGDC